MAYAIDFLPKLRKILRKLPEEMERRIRQKIISLADDPRPPDVKKLAGKMEGLYRVRVGVYRIIYTIEDDKLLILVVDIDHRKDIYR